MNELKEILPFYESIITIWRKGICALTLITCFVIIYVQQIYDKLQVLSFYYIEYWSPIIFICLFLIVWLILTQRIFFRDGWRVLVWIGCWFALTLSFPFYIYPFHIAESLIDLPFIIYWGSAIVGIISWVIIRCVKVRFFRDERIIIVFAISSQVNTSESMIRESIEHTIVNIENRFPSIKIVIPPFGYIDKVNKCERYIKRSITQADAMIYAQIIPGNEDGNLGYIYTSFMSVINSNRHKNFNGSSNAFLGDVLSKQFSAKEWNSFNISHNTALAKLKIAENLEGMLLMYCSALYMFMNEFITALPVAKRMFDLENNPHSSIVATAKGLLSFAYLASAVKYEHQHHDYQQAYDNLNECLKLFPSIKNNISYIKTMARLEYYRGDIKSSKKYTREFKRIEGVTWGYCLNMGFYALCENKIGEWVNWYKKLCHYKCSQSEVTFAVEFIEHEHNKFKKQDNDYLYEISIAYLNLFTNKKRAAKKWNKIIEKHRDNDIFLKLKELSSVKSDVLLSARK